MNVQMIESGLFNGVSKIAIWNNALRRSCQNHSRVVGIHERSELVGHGTVSTTSTSLNIEVETVNHKGTERTRAGIVGRLRAEHIPHLVGKINTSIVSGQRISRARITTNRYQDLLALALTLLNVGF